MSDGWQGPLEKIDDCRWKIPQSYMSGMKVPGVIYADEKLLKNIKRDKAPQQVANAAHLPGIVRYSLAMPDIHWGYGLPIGGVVATDVEKGGVITPGGVGYDINCGVRLIRSNLSEKEVKPKLDSLLPALFSKIPAGVGSKSNIKVTDKEESEIMVKGARWAVEKKGFGTKDDLEHTEERGTMEGADPDRVSERASPSYMMTRCIPFSPSGSIPPRMPSDTPLVLRGAFESRLKGVTILEKVSPGGTMSGAMLLFLTSPGTIPWYTKSPFRRPSCR